MRAAPSRWDITADIHKVWLVHDHREVPGVADSIVRAVVAPVPISEASPVVMGALHEAPAHAATTIYDVGPSKVGFMSCAPGRYSVAPRMTTETFFVTSGLFYLTNQDGSARRCVAGDTVVLPKGWSGQWDVVEQVTKVWIEVDPTH